MIQGDGLEKIHKLTRKWSFNYMFDTFYYPQADQIPKHKDDKSLLTFYGHEVLHTLIRCEFSSYEQNGARYIVSGSSDGVIHIFDILTGKVAMKIDSAKELSLKGIKTK